MYKLFNTACSEVSTSTKGWRAIGQPIGEVCNLDFKERTKIGWQYNEKQNYAFKVVTTSPEKDNASETRDGSEKGKKIKREKRTVDEVLCEDPMAEEEISGLSDKEIVHLAIGERSKALKLQRLAREGSEAVVERIVQAVLPKVDRLIKDPLGNYLLQQLLPRSAKLLGALENIPVENLYSLSSHEFGSRVLQLLVQLSSKFHGIATSAVSSQLHIFTRDFSSVFFISSLLKCAPEDSHREFVPLALENDPSWLNNKYFKRVLATYLELASQSNLQRIFDLVLSYTDADTLLQDKYLSMIVLSFLHRNFNPVLETLKSVIISNPESFLCAKHTQYVLSQLSRTESSQLAALMEQLRSLPHNSWRIISSNAHMYTTLSTIFSNFN